jgi:phage-related protein
MADNKDYNLKPLEETVGILRESMTQLHEIVLKNIASEIALGKNVLSIKPLEEYSDELTRGDKTLERFSEAIRATSETVRTLSELVQQSGAAHALQLPVIRQLSLAFQPLVGAVGSAWKAFSAQPGKTVSDNPSGTQEGKESGKEGQVNPFAEVAKKSPILGVMKQIADVGMGVVQSFASLSQVSMQFVQALNPSLIGLFNQTMRDFTATIGKALEPIAYAANEVMRHLADALTPVMDQLQPAMQLLADAFSGVLKTGADLLAQTLTMLAPLFEAVGQVFAILGSVVEGVMRGFSTVLNLLPLLLSGVQGAGAAFNALLYPIRGIATLFADLMRTVQVLASGLMAAFEAVFSGLGSAFKDVAGFMVGFGEGMQGAVRMIAKLIILMAAAAAKLLGFTSFIDGMIKGIKPTKEGASVGAAAPQNAQIMDISSLGRDLAQRAFTASGGGGKKTEDWLSDIAGMLEEIKGGKSLETVIKDGILAAIPGGTIVNNTASGIGSAVGYVGGGIGSAWGGVSSFVGGAFGSLGGGVAGMFGRG